jgi:hypothetical protein
MASKMFPFAARSFSLWTSFALTCAAPWLAGCSVLFTTSPPSDAERLPAGAPIECTTTKAAPIVDSVLAGLQVARVGLAAAADDSVYRDAPISREADIGIGVAMATLFLSSAVYGYSVTGRCADLKARTWSDDAMDSRENLPPPGERRPAPSPSSDQPPWAGAFLFGATSEEVAAVCRQAGHEWRQVEGAAHCSGAPSAGIPYASAELEFADGRLSGIELVIQPPEDAQGWAEAFRETEATLTRLHGKAQQRSFVVPDECKAAERFLSCIADGTVTGSAVWSLRDGRSVALSMAGAPSPATIRVRIAPGRREP